MSLIIEVENYSQCKNKKKKLKACFTPEKCQFEFKKKTFAHNGNICTD